MTKLRTLLFDMGNVLVYFSHRRMCEQIGNVTGIPEQTVRSLLLDSGLQWQFERGEVTPAQFHRRWEELTHRRIDRQALLHAGSNIFHLNFEVVPILDTLKRAGHRLVLLSNTSAAHFDFVRTHFSVLDRFDDYVLSYEVGAMKPDRAIFAAALEAIGCPPEECFYTDDIPPYVAAGREAGLQAEVFTTATELTRHLASHGVVV